MYLFHIRLCCSCSYSEHNVGWIMTEEVKFNEEESQMRTHSGFSHLVFIRVRWFLLSSKNTGELGMWGGGGRWENKMQNFP